MAKIKFSVATNWQDDLIPKIKRGYIEEIYGKLSADFVGGGRPSYLLPHPTKEQVQVHIQESHKNGLKFNYLLNAPCMGGREFTSVGQRQIHKILDWLVKINADSITVSVPYLAELIKRRYPKFKICISSYVKVNTVKSAKFWEDLGADLITLHPPSVNRNFSLLREIRKNVKCKLQLIANNACIYGCPLSLSGYHGILASHQSQSFTTATKYSVLFDYCVLKCRYERLINPVQFIRSDWIRPEDIHVYGELGIDRIKLVDRTASTDDLLLVVDAYSKQYYEGNLIALFLLFCKKVFLQKNKVQRKISKSDLLRLRELATYKDVIYIDNRTLDGFLDFFLKGNCRWPQCNDCGYCEQIAKKSIRINSIKRAKLMLQFKNALNNLILGRYWKKEKFKKNFK